MRPQHPPRGAHPLEPALLLLLAVGVFALSAEERARARTTRARAPRQIPLQTYILAPASVHFGRVFHGPVAPPSGAALQNTLFDAWTALARISRTRTQQRCSGAHSIRACPKLSRACPFPGPGVPGIPGVYKHGGAYRNKTMSVSTHAAAAAPLAHKAACPSPGASSARPTYCLSTRPRWGHAAMRLCNSARD